MPAPDIVGEWVPVGDLVPWDENPRHNDDAVDEVAGSIQRFGFAAPIIARRADSMVIAGHTRLKAAQRLGINKVPVRWMDLDPSEARMLALADNKLNERADWDDDLLSGVLAQLQEDGADLEGLGWDDEEIDALIADAGPEVELPEDIEPAEPPKEPDSKPGEVYELGPHRLVCGDSTDAAVWGSLLGGDSATLTITSPPYNVGGNTVHGQRSEKYDIHDDDDAPDVYRDLLVAFLACALERCEYAMVNLQILAANKVAVFEWLNEFRHRYADMLIWNKGHGEPAMAERVMNAAFECVFIFSKETRPGRNIKTAEFRGTVQNVYAAGGQSGNAYASEHSATFPLHLPEHLMESFDAARGDVVDPFGGTGTTLIAAARTGRQARLIELSPAYCDIIRDRWTRWAIEAGQDPGPGALTLERD